MEQLDLIETVSNELVKRGYNASFEHPGYIQIEVDKLTIDFGTANDFWDGDIEDEARDCSGVVSTKCPSDCEDVPTIVQALVEAIESCRTSRFEVDCNGLDTYNQCVIRDTHRFGRTVMMLDFVDLGISEAVAQRAIVDAVVALAKVLNAKG